MMSKTLKRPEVLSPAGTLEKLKVAIDYGADAVFVGGQATVCVAEQGTLPWTRCGKGLNMPMPVVPRSM